MKRVFIFLSLVLLFSQTSLLAVSVEKYRQKRADQLAAFVNNKSPQLITSVFDKSFLQAVPEAKLAPIFKNIRKNYGAITKQIFVKQKDSTSLFHFYTEKKLVMKVYITLQQTSPYRVTGLWFGPAKPFQDTIEKVLEEFKKMPGTLSLALAELEGKKIKLLHSIQPEKSLALGSTFKLYILGALMEDVAAKKHRWGQVTTLKEKCRSYPSGQFHKWPAKSPITLHSLAGWMISISDNTATDHLLFFLGRERVETFAKKRGNQDGRNFPFLSTAEMFRLKFNPQSKFIEEYLKLDEGGKRLYLSQVVSAFSPKKSVSGGLISKPRYIEELEWFATTAELCKLMNWIRINSEKGTGQKAREILAINPGLQFDDPQWKYIGYKGGSEPGVLNMTYLLQRKDGKWFALSITWNNTKAPLENLLFFGRVQRLMALLGKGKK